LLAWTPASIVWYIYCEIDENDDEMCVTTLLTLEEDKFEKLSLSTSFDVFWQR